MSCSPAARRESVPSSFQDACRHPERVVVAHPFNPPHLVPLVEVVGGRQTSEEAIDATMSLMSALGRRPVRVRAELPGHVVNRLQAALWREAYDLVRRGAISVADLDLAVSSGPGLRWALLGPIATQHLSGGPGGLAHVLEHLGPPMVDWWADLGEPELTPELAGQLVDGVTEELDGQEHEVLARRDRALGELLALKDRLGLSGGSRVGGIRRMRDQGLGSWTRRRARMTPAKAALVQDGTSMSYGDLDRATTRLAHGLRARGVERGDRVAFLGLNSLEMVVAMFAVAKLGAVYVPVNTRLAPPELAYVLDHSGATLLLVEDALAEPTRRPEVAELEIETVVFTRAAGAPASTTIDVATTPRTSPRSTNRWVSTTSS